MPLYTPGGGAASDATLSVSDITTNNASTSAHGFLKKLSNVSTEYMSGTGVFSTPAGSSITTAHAECSADVTLTADTTADATGASVSLAAGTWDIYATVGFKKASVAAGYMLAYIRDGAGTVVASGRSYLPAVNEFQSIPVFARVTPGSTTTYKLSGAASATNDKIVKFPDGSTIGTQITAFKVA